LEAYASAAPSLPRTTYGAARGVCAAIRHAILARTRPIPAFLAF
jgi:hypothetical protein